MTFTEIKNTFLTTAVTSLKLSPHLQTIVKNYPFLLLNEKFIKVVGASYECFAFLVDENQFTLLIHDTYINTDRLESNVEKQGKELFLIENKDFKNQTVYVQSNDIFSLELTQFKAKSLFVESDTIERVKASFNHLDHIDVSKCPKLRKLFANQNKKLENSGIVLAQVIDQVHAKGTLVTEISGMTKNSQGFFEKGVKEDQK